MLKRVIVFWVCKTGIHTVTKYCHAFGYLLVVLNRLTLYLLIKKQISVNLCRYVDFETSCLTPIAYS